MAAFIVFYLIRLHPQADDAKEFAKARVRALGHFLVSLVFLMLIFIPLAYFMHTTIRHSLEQEKIYTLLQENLPGNKIYSYQIKQDNAVDIKLILLEAHPLSEQVIRT